MGEGFTFGICGKSQTGHTIANGENAEIWKQFDGEISMWWTGYKTRLQISKIKWTTIGKFIKFI